MDVEIRAAREDEVDAILPMYEWLFEDPGSEPELWDPERARVAVREAIAAEGSTVLVADEGGSLVGICTAYLDLNSVRFGLRCWVEDLAVHPERRSRGIGADLLGAARHWAGENGATHLELDTAHPRARARRFYERQGPVWSSVSYAWDV